MYQSGSIVRADGCWPAAAAGGLGFVFAAGPAVSGSAAAGPAAPIALGISLAVMGLQALFARRGPQQRIQATQIVNEAEPYLVQNRDAYLASDRSPENYAQALANFDYAWGRVLELCSDPQLGNPGRACIEDRQPGGRWDWFAYYRDPIEAAAPVSSAGSGPASAAGGAAAAWSRWLLPAGLAVAGLILLES